MVTHGSVTLAGKVRSVTPKLPRKERRNSKAKYARHFN